MMCKLTPCVSCLMLLDKGLLHPSWLHLQQSVRMLGHLIHHFISVAIVGSTLIHKPLADY